MLNLSSRLFKISVSSPITDPPISNELTMKIATKQLITLNQKDISEILLAIGMGKHIDAFKENNIQGQILERVSDSDLKDIGIARFNEIKKIQHHFLLA